MQKSTCGQWLILFGRQKEDGYILRSFVARSAVVASIDGASLKAWIRNRFTELVSFRIGEKGKMVGEAWAPKEGLSAA